MTLRRFAISMMIVFAVVVGFWALSGTHGMRVSLLGSLALSIALTVVLNVVLAAFGRRRRA
jgi:hypothetical protein